MAQRETMRNLLALVLVALLAVACQGNPVSPMTPPSSGPETPATPLPAAPKAVLSVGRGDVNPPLGVVNFTRMLFDGSRSEGDGLTYLLEFGDGLTSTDPVVTHRPEVAPSSGFGDSRLLTARLTVTDKYGRSDSTTQRYFVAPVDNVSGTFWSNVLSPNSRRPVGRSFVLAQQGSTLSGWYSGPEGRNHRVTGTLSDERTIHLRTENGAIEFIGAHDWRAHDSTRPEDDGLHLVLRLSMRGGMANGAVLDFDYADPY